MSASVTTVKSGDESSSFLNRIPWYFQMLLLVVLVFILLFASHALFYSDLRSQTVKLKEQAEQLKVKNQQGSIIRQNLAATEQTLREKHEEIERLRDLLPDQVEISKVFDNIKDYMKAQRLELKRFAPLKPASAEYYTAQPIEVEINGTYDNLGQFFSQLGFYKRIVSVTDVDVKQAEDAGQEIGRTINSSFVVTAYYISQENLDKLTMKKPAAPAQPVKGKPAQPAK
jgi:type IV pilus assembly protein PilO